MKGFVESDKRKLHCIFRKIQTKLNRLCQKQYRLQELEKSLRKARDITRKTIFLEGFSLPGKTCRLSGKKHPALFQKFSSAEGEGVSCKEWQRQKRTGSFGTSRGKIPNVEKQAF